MNNLLFIVITMSLIQLISINFTDTNYLDNVKLTKTY